MPTGVVNQSENITRGSEREVLEETGLRVKFQSVLAIRQAHNFAFGKSDMFFVVALRSGLTSRGCAEGFLSCLMF